ncbi:MAG TPA: glycosyltransferase family 39 protein [Candidatus Omnitrophota bacterium]|nr:glycosyltransferase family 39 protein [Candidatus Omnitrophota bacterium]
MNAKKISLLLGIGILCSLALSVRLWGINFGLPGLCNPDENLFVEGALKVASGNLEPATFRSGNLIFYVLAFVYGALYSLLKIFGIVKSSGDFLVTYYCVNPTVLFIIGRLTMAIISCLGILLTYKLGSRIFNTRTGVIAAILLIFSYVHVQQAHFIKEDMLASFFLLASFLSLTPLLTKDSRCPQARCYGWGGLFLGLAIAAKYTSFVGLAFLAAFHFLTDHQKNVSKRFFAKWFIVSLICVGIGFFLGEPFALLQYKRFIRDFFNTASSPALGLDRGWQPSWLFYITEHLKNGVGIFTEIAIGFGIMLAAKIDMRKTMLLICFPACLLIVLNTYKPHASYYMVPAIPFLLIFAGLFFDRIFLKIQNPGLRIGIFIAAISIYVSTSVFDTVRLDYLLSRPDTRMLASAWIQQNIPHDSTIFVEGSYGAIIAGGPPLESNIKALLREMSFVKQHGGQGLLWDAKINYAGKTPQIVRYDLYKGISLTKNDVTENTTEYVIISGYYNFASGYLLMSLEERRNTLELLTKHYALIKTFVPYPNMDETPHLVLMDFNTLRTIDFFGKQRNNVLQGPTIEIYKRI